MLSFFQLNLPNKGGLAIIHGIFLREANIDFELEEDEGATFFFFFKDFIGLELLYVLRISLNSQKPPPPSEASSPYLLSFSDNFLHLLSSHAKFLKAVTGNLYPFPENPA